MLLTYYILMLLTFITNKTFWNTYKTIIVRPICKVFLYNNFINNEVSQIMKPDYVNLLQYCKCFPVYFLTLQLNLRRTFWILIRTIYCFVYSCSNSTITNHYGFLSGLFFYNEKQVNTAYRSALNFLNHVLKIKM